MDKANGPRRRYGKKTKKEKRELQQKGTKKNQKYIFYIFILAVLLQFQSAADTEPRAFNTFAR
jgi:hypothetical protein